jgi:thiamine biosynthesis lipoprotein ApbE
VRPFGTLDPSGLVKGWAVARAAERLRERGARNCLISAGGDILAGGRPAPGARWRVGIRNPADAYATAIFATGEDGPAFAAQLEGFDPLCITAADEILSTEGMGRHRLR